MLRSWLVRFAGIVMVFAVAASSGFATAAVAAPHRTAVKHHLIHAHRRAQVVRIARAGISVRIVSAPASPSHTGAASFAWATSGRVRFTSCSIDGGAFTTCAAPKGYAGLTDGSHTFTVRVSEGNAVALTKSTWTVALPSETDSSQSATPTTTATPTIATPTIATPTTPTTTPTPTPTPTTPSIANPYGQAMFGVAAGGALQNEDPSTLASDLSTDAQVGSKWLRIDINWAQIQAGGASSYDWTNIDNVVKGAEADGMSVLGVIVYTPSWDRPAGTDASYGPSPASYAAFAATAVAHYSAMGVNAYEIWNEENSAASWTPTPSPSAYTALLKAAYPAIKTADPNATVITGGLSPDPTDGTNFLPTDFLSAIYADGGQGSFDAVGAHPYCWPAMPGDAQGWSAWYQMYGASTSLRSIMVAHGDGNKKIWGTEYGAPTNGPAGSYVSQATQATMISTAFAQWSTYSWAGPLFIYQGRDEGTDTSTNQNFFGFINNDGTPKLGYSAYQQAVATY